MTTGERPSLTLGPPVSISFPECQVVIHFLFCASALQCSVSYTSTLPEVSEPCLSTKHEVAPRLQLLTTQEQSHCRKEQCTGCQRALGLSSQDASCSATICVGLSLRTVLVTRLGGDFFLTMSPLPQEGDWCSVRTKNPMCARECQDAGLNHALNYLPTRCRSGSAHPRKGITLIHSFVECVFECLALGRRQRTRLQELVNSTR